MANSYFMLIDGISGESTDDKHAKWIEVKTFNHDINQEFQDMPSAAGGIDTSGVNMGAFTVTKEVDLSSPTLSAYCCDGKTITTINLELCRANESQTVYMTWKFEDAKIVKVSVSGDGNRPTETVEIKFSKIWWSYTPVNHDGSVGSANEKNWDLQVNKQG